MKHVRFMVSLLLCIAMMFPHTALAAAKPAIHLTQVPRLVTDWDNMEDTDAYYLPVMGKVELNGLDPSKHSIIVFLDGGWIKPYWSSYLTEIAQDGSFSVRITTGGHDPDIDGFRLFIVKTTDFINYNGDPSMDEVLQKSVYDSGVLKKSEFVAPLMDFKDQKNAALAYLTQRLDAGNHALYVYRDFADSGNYFTQKAKMGSGNADFVYDMDENWAMDVYSGSSAIRCHVNAIGSNWGGWLFLNGVLLKGETVPQLSFGEYPGAGLDLRGATELRFIAKGENGGEVVEFFTAGLAGTYPDSSKKQTMGFITLTNSWKEYAIDLSGMDLSSIGCGFGFTVSGTQGTASDTVFYLDDIRFTGAIAMLNNAPRMIRSYEIGINTNPNGKYIQNAAFSYDNALASMAYISAGDKEHAKVILDAFVYAVKNDRYKPDRVRNAYAAGNISPFPGWESGTRLPGWYDSETKQYYEDQYQVGSNVGNSSYVALALLQYYKAYGGDTYLRLAETLMDWVLTCTDATPGFTAGYDGWPEADKAIVYTYKSIEHNIDAYAAFKQLYTMTGKEKYKDASESALAFIQSMYDKEKKVFYTGTGTDGKTPSRENIVLDAQVWCALALGDDFAPYQDVFKRVLAMQNTSGGFPFHEANTNGGYWNEGTAFTALALEQFGYKDAAQKSLKAVTTTQLTTGGFPAATVDGLSTGFTLFTGDPWEYGSSPHIAPTAWFVMAVNGFNPYAF